MSPDPGSCTVVFDPAGTPYHTFRIPALLSVPAAHRDHRDGDDGGSVLLAFCEGRLRSSADTGPIELVLRRSVDGRRTWVPLQVVCRADGKTCGNPVPVLVPRSGDVVLLSTQNGAQVAEPAVARGTVDDRDTRRVQLQRSADRGRSWTEPVEINHSVKRTGGGWYAIGPGQASVSSTVIITVGWWCRPTRP